MRRKNHSRITRFEIDFIGSKTDGIGVAFDHYFAGYLRHPWELAEVGGAFFDESVFAFFAFFGHVVHEGGVAGEV